MPRIKLYSQQEDLLNRKKLEKLANFLAENQSDTRTNKRKSDTSEVLTEKKKSRRERDKEMAESSTSGLTRAHTNENINQRLSRVFNRNYEHYTVSLPFASVIKPPFRNTFLREVQLISSFSRELSREFSDIQIYFIRRIVDEYAVFLVTYEEEPSLDVLNIIQDVQIRERMLFFFRGGQLINEINNILPNSSRQNPLNKARVLRAPGMVIQLFRKVIAEYEEYNIKFSANTANQIVQSAENISGSSIVSLQTIKATNAAIMSSVSASEALLLSAEAPVVVAQDQNSISPEGKITSVLALKGSTMTSHCVTYNASTSSVIIRSLSSSILKFASETLNLVNNSFVSSTRTKEIAETTVISAQNFQNHSERLVTAAQNSVISAEEAENPIKLVDSTLDAFPELSKTALNEVKRTIHTTEAAVRLV
ncbi:hypothetical protein BDF21DRAFT_400263 [Thamnidium elegans]|nr:hypothetical protein BDF21DRAFT_400263 [Thamnidium elegans]